MLASLLCIILYIARVVYSNRFLEYRNLVWNLALAWIPYTISFSIAAVHTVFRRGWWFIVPIPSLSWLLFFPNAPYIVTDFLHLQFRPPVPIWFDIGLVACYAFTGILIASVSLHTLQGLISAKFGSIIGWLFAAIALVLSSLGIYLGRFGRFNSWDIIFAPKKIIKILASPIFNPLDNLQLIGFSVLFTAILFVFYVTFTSYSQQNR